MNALLIATHDQAVHAIGERLEQPGTCELLRGVVLKVLAVHGSVPPASTTPDGDCPDCSGSGLHLPYGLTEPQHCHCRCPWCAGCDEPLCRGACPTVEAIAERLDLLSNDLPKEEDQP